MPAIPDEIRHSIAEIVNYDYATEEADYVREHEPEGHVFEHLKRINDWLIAGAPPMTPPIADAWGALQNYIDGQDDLTDEECEAVDVIADVVLAREPMVPLAELVAAVGANDTDDEGIINGSAGDQLTGLYELLNRYGFTVA